MPVIKAH